MKKLSILLLLLLTLASCSKVPAGYVGVKFYLLGGDKGVDSEELSPGRYWIGINEELYNFPTFTQNYVWTSSKDEGSINDESFNFQDIDGLELNADVGITYKISPDQVTEIFEKYKRGVEEITDIYLRNMVRDALVETSSQFKVSHIYGIGKAEVMNIVEAKVREQVGTLGIEVEKLYWIGRIKLPPAVKESIDMKTKATQLAMQKENELRQTEAEKQKLLLKADGEAGAILKVAEAQAKANRLLNASITKTLVEYKKIEKWDGILPKFSGTNALISVDE